MAALLHIDSSPMGERSISRNLTWEFVNQWRSAHPEGRVIRRDLAAITIPVVDAAWIAANYTPKESRTAALNDIVEAADAIAEFYKRRDRRIISRIGSAL